MAQIGTIKAETQNNGTVSVPVFDVGDSGSSVYEFVRVQTAGGTGFIPVVDPADASYPYLRVQSQNQGVVAVTDVASLQPSSGIFRYSYESSGDTSTITDDWNSNDATVGGNPQWSTDSQEGTYSLDLDGNDYADIPRGAPSANVSVASWVKFDSTGRNYVVAYQGNEQWVFGWDELNGGWDWYTNPGGGAEGFNNINLGITTGTWYHVVGVYDGSYILYVNGQQEASTGGSYTNANGNNLGLGYASGANDAYMDGHLDNTDLYNKALTSTEVSNLYNTGSI